MLITTSSNNIDHYQETLREREMDVEVLQTSAGTFNTSLESLVLPNLRLTLANISMESRFIYHGVFCTENQYVIHFPIDSRPLHINGQNISKNGLNVFNPDEPVIVRNSRDTSKRSLNVLFNANLLMQFKEDDLSNLLDDKNSIQKANEFSDLNFERIKITLLHYILPIFKNSPILTPHIVSDIEDSVYSYIVELLLNLRMVGPPNRIHSKHQLAVVSRALEYIRDCEDISIRVPTLLEHAFCSHRTLQYSFKRILGVTPKRFLSIRRLHLIRDAVIRRPELNISQLASSYGVVNLGRFSHDFYQLFGIKPLDLRKSLL